MLRDCTPSDIAAVTAIYAHAVRHGRASFEVDPPDATEMARRRDAVLTGGFPYLVAEIGGAVVGYAYAGAYRSRPAYAGTVESSVYVTPRLQARGIGGALLAELVDEAAARGFRQMVAVIGDSANAASVRLHARAGFRLVGTLASVGWKHGVWLDTVLMQRPLGDGDRSPPARPPLQKPA
ncbi:MAG: N-acetyltransferase family protein [Rhodoplanes sp.]|nr:N-acetyltransferase family protein [Rhodoplanes sp.]